MALELMDEHERGESVRAWLRQNGGAIFTGVAIGIAVLVGWRWWDHSKVEHRVTAATQYQALNEAVERKDPETVAALSAELAKSYGDTPYAGLAALQLAEVELAAGDKDAALAALQQASELGGDAAFVGLVNLRRARVMLSSGDAEGALKLVDGSVKDSYAGLAAELRGDALQTLGRGDDARQAYQDALTSLDTGAPNRRIVEMKLADLGGAPAQPEA